MKRKALMVIFTMLVFSTIHCKGTGNQNNSNSAEAGHRVSSAISEPLPESAQRFTANGDRLETVNKSVSKVGVKTDNGYFAAGSPNVELASMQLKRGKIPVNMKTLPASKQTSPININLSYSGDDPKYKGTVQFDAILYCQTQFCMGKTVSVDYIIPVGLNVVSGEVSSERLVAANTERDFPLTLELSSLGEFKVGVEATIGSAAVAVSILYITVTESDVRIITEQDVQNKVVNLKTMERRPLNEINHREGMAEPKGPATPR